MSTVIATISTEHPGYGHHLRKAIDSYAAEVICFDYFDTLVTRNVHPEDVKRIACERLSRILGHPSAGQELYRQRAELEAALCRQNLESGADLEFRIHSLLAALWEQNPVCRSIDKTRFVETAIDVEVSIECAVQVPDDEMITVLRELKEAGRECWLISDFYMPYQELSRVLMHHGLDTLFSQIHVSADSLLTKRSGRLYPHAMKRGQRQGHALLMIGDNSHSDVASALSNQVAAIQIDRDHQHRNYQALTIASNDFDLTEREIDQIFANDRTPFKELALTLYRFIDELHHRLVGSGARDVFFMAREGQFLKRMFDSYQERRRTKDSCLVRSHYIEVSRRATFLPSLKEIGKESFETLFRQYRRISAEEFLSSLGLAYLAPGLAPAIPYSLSERMEDLPTSDVFAALIDAPLFREAYEHERLTRRNAFKTYLDSFDLAGNPVDMHFVDVGWKGTIQDNLSNILQQLGDEYAQRRLQGHYIGLVADGAAHGNSRKSGVIFSCTGPVSKNFSVFNENRALFEVALGADHGSAYSYEMNATGGVNVMRHDFTEAPLFFHKVQPLQNQLLRLFEAVDLILIDRIFPSRRLEALATRNHARMVFNPTNSEVRWFEDVYHVENFGVFELSNFSGGHGVIGFIDKINFYLKLRKAPSDMEMGFWPWLTCLQRGGKLVAARYGRARMKGIEQ